MPDHTGKPFGACRGFGCERFPAGAEASVGGGAGKQAGASAVPDRCLARDRTDRGESRRGLRRRCRDATRSQFDAAGGGFGDAQVEAAPDAGASGETSAPDAAPDGAGEDVAPDATPDAAPDVTSEPDASCESAPRSMRVVRLARSAPLPGTALRCASTATAPWPATRASSQARCAASSLISTSTR